MTGTPSHYWRESEQAAVRQQLDRIFKSASFQQSRRRIRFLDYVVSETLAGRGDRLKGYIIAREVFDRADTFDANTDPIVRIEVGRVRDRLREYYETAGQSDPVRIDLPKGTYTPSIEFRQVPLADAAISGDAADDSVAPLAPAPGSSSTAVPVWRRMINGWPLVLPAAALVLFLAVAGAWLYGSRGSLPPRPREAQSSIDIVSVPAVAVLPFTNLSGDPKQDYFSDGLTEDILTELARSRDLRVIARNTTFQYKGQAVDVTKLGRDLRVRYVIEGSARRVENRVRIIAQLIDAETGTHLWADKYDREMADLFVVQDEVVNQIVGRIAGGYGAIESTETKSALRKSPDQIQSYDLVLRAREAMQWDWTAETFRTARGFLNQAIALDPSNSRGRRELAWVAVMGWVFRLDDAPVPAEEITVQAAKAVELDPGDASAHLVAASAHFFTKRLDQFGFEAEQALALAPYDAEIMAALGCMISAAGDHKRGVALARKANAINADAATGWYHSTVYTALYLEGDYKGALEIANQNHDAEMFYSYIEIIPIYGQLGMKQEAQAAWRGLVKTYPNPTAKSFEDWWRLWNMRDEEVARLMDGVYKSGVFGPEVKLGQ